MASQCQQDVPARDVVSKCTRSQGDLLPIVIVPYAAVCFILEGTEDQVHLGP